MLQVHPKKSAEMEKIRKMYLVIINRNIVYEKGVE